MIIFLHGPDTFRSKAKLKELKEKYFREIAQGKHNLITVDGETIDLKGLHDLLSASSFLAEKRMIVVENVLKKANKKITAYVLEFLQKQTSADIYLFFEGDLQKTTDPLFVFLKKEKYVQEFKLLPPKELRAWMKDRFLEHGLSLTDSTAETLRELTGGDLWQMKEEIDKIAAYTLATAFSGAPPTAVANKKNVVSTSTIRTLTQGKNDESVFSFLDALAEKNISLALSLLHDQLEAGKSEIYMLALIVGLFRNLIQIKDAVISDPSLTFNEIASSLRLHPFVVRKISKSIDRFSAGELKKIYRSLLAVDVKLKSERVLRPELFIDLLIAGFSQMPRG
jgi:DNA polymerase-3 subunit delta